MMNKLLNSTRMTISIWIIRIILIFVAYYFLKESFLVFENGPSDLFSSDPELVKNNLLLMYFVASLILLAPTELIKLKKIFNLSLAKPFALVISFSFVSYAKIEHYGFQALLFPYYIWALVESGLIAGVRSFINSEEKYSEKNYRRSIKIFVLNIVAVATVIPSCFILLVKLKVSDEILIPLFLCLFILPFSILFSHTLKNLIFQLLAKRNKL